MLRDVQELDYNEIAALLDVPLGTVKSRIHSARQIVQPLLTAGADRSRAVSPAGDVPRTRSARHSAGSPR